MKWKLSQMWLKRISIILLQCFLISCATHVASIAPTIGSKSSKDNKQSILANPGIEHFKKELQALVDERGQSGNHHFYISYFPAGSSTTYILWKEGRKFWILSMGNESEYSWMGVRYPSGGQYLDLDKDVVATENEVGSSTYLVTQSWINEKVFQMVLNGDLLILHSDK